MLSTNTVARHAGQRRTYFSSTKMQEYPAPQLHLERDAKHSYFAVCTCIKDQNADIREWVHYYHWLGASTIYIYDHASRRPAIVDLEDWVRSGVVHYNFFAFQNRRANVLNFALTAQGQAYHDCLNRARGKHTWLAFFDVDEFLVPMQPLAPGAAAPDGAVAAAAPLTSGAAAPLAPGAAAPLGSAGAAASAAAAGVAPSAAAAAPNVSAILADYEEYAGLGVNWRVFGSSGHRTRPGGVSTLEAYTRCIPDDVPASQNRHVKMIVNVAKAMGVGPDPHQFVYAQGSYAVNEQFQRLEGPFSEPVSVQRLALHHYVLKSEEEFREKTRRGSGVGNIKTQEYWDAVESDSSATCLAGVAIGKACCSRTKRLQS